MFCALPALPRKFAHFSCLNAKNLFRNPIRVKSTIANAARSQSQKVKKEPVEVIKWILLAIPISTLGLGSWQVYRLQWKLKLIDIMEATTNAAPVDLPTDYNELQTMEYKPVKVRGEFLHEKEILIGPRALIEHTSMARFGSLVSDPKKNQGWLVITPLRLADTGEEILVNRGWIPQNLKPKENRAASLIKDTVELTGVVRLTEKRPPFMPKNHPEKGSWFYRDLEQMSAYLDCAPVWIDARGVPDPPAGWPIPNQTRVTLRNEHLSYLVTWYSLSAFTAFMWHRYFIRKLPLL